MRTFASGDLDESRIAELLAAGAQVDGIGIGTRSGVSQYAPAIGIVYKLAQCGDKGLSRASPDKATGPGRKSITRFGDRQYEKNVVAPFNPDANDLLKPFISAGPMETIQKRLAGQLARLPDATKAIRSPGGYPIEFADLSG